MAEQNQVSNDCPSLHLDLEKYLKSVSLSDGIMRAYSALRTNLLYDYISDLVPPTVLARDRGKYEFTIRLTGEQATQIGMSRELITDNSGLCDYIHGVKAILRVCKVENSMIKIDRLPSKMKIKINGSQFLRELEGPMDITNFFKINPNITNHLDVEYTTYWKGSYLLTVILVRGVKSEAVVAKLLKKRTRNKEFTKYRIVSMMKMDSNELAVTSKEMTLICPLSQTLIRVPCQGETCCHLECFDALTYLNLNVYSGKWICPICKKTTPACNLVIDGYWKVVLEAMRKMSLQCITVSLLQNGSWAPSEHRPELNECSIVTEEVGTATDRAGRTAF